MSQVTISLPEALAANSSPTIEVPFNPDAADVVADIKRHVERVTGVSPVDQRLASVGAADAVPNQLRLVVRERQASLVIQVSELNDKVGKQLRTQVDPTDTIRDLKFIISGELGSPVETLRLYLGMLSCLGLSSPHLLVRLFFYLFVVCCDVIFVVCRL